MADVDFHVGVMFYVSSDDHVVDRTVSLPRWDVVRGPRVGIVLGEVRRGQHFFLRCLLDDGRVATFPPDGFLYASKPLRPDGRLGRWSHVRGLGRPR